MAQERCSRDAIEPVQPRGGDPALLPRLRDVRHRRARAARRARRPEAGPPADPLVDARGGAAPRPPVPQVRGRRRRGAEEVPPARRPVRLRRAGPHGAGLLPARPARRRARQLRLGRRRPAGRACGTPRRGSRRWRWRCSATSTPRPSTSSRTTTGTSSSRVVLPGAVPEPARQRLRRHRRRHGDEHPAAQPRRGDRRGRPLHRQPGGDAEGPDEVRQGSRLPDRRGHHGQRGHPGRLRDRSRVDQDPRGLLDRGGPQRPLAHRRHRAPVPGQQGASGGEDRRAGAAPARSRTSPT